MLMVVSGSAAHADRLETQLGQLDLRLDGILEDRPREAARVNGVQVKNGSKRAGNVDQEDDIVLDYRTILPSAWEGISFGEELPDLMLEALLGSPEVLVKRSELEAAGFDLETAKWGRFPSLSADLESADSGGSVAVARLEQPLWTGGRITGQIDAAEAELSVANAALEEQKLSAMLEVAASYYEIVRLKVRLQIANVNEDEHQRLLNIIKRRVEAKVSAKADRTQAEARMQQAVRERIQTEQQLVTAIAKLERLITREVDELATPKWIDFGDWSEQELLSEALDFSPVLKRLRAEVDAAKADIKVTKSGWWPQLIAGVKSTSTSGSSTSTADGENAYLALRVQTGAGLSNLSSTKAASSRMRASDSALLAEQQELRRQIQSAWAEYKGLSGQLEPARALRASSSDIIESYLRQFQVGRKSWLDVLNAQREKALANYALADTEFPLLSVQVRLLLLTGEINVMTMKTVL